MNILDPILSWTLQLPLGVSIFILALAITLIVNVVYKYTTDQNEMKRMKDRQKELQKKMKSHKDNPKKMMKVQSELMTINMDYMKKSMKPTLYTLIPLLIIFAWMNTHFMFVPLQADVPIDLTAKLTAPAQVTIETDLDVVGEATKPTIEEQVTFTVSGDPGLHTVKFSTESGAVAEQIVVIDGLPEESVTRQDKPFKQTTVDYQKTRPLGGFSLFGWEPGWLGTYIIFSIILSMVTRRLMKIH